jgi:hypothetical protein
MTVPKTAVDENDLLISGQNNIRIARQFSNMQTESISHSMQDTSDLYFRLGVPTSNSGHDPTSFALVKDVRHSLASFERISV